MTNKQLPYRRQLGTGRPARRKNGPGIIIALAILLAAAVTAAWLQREHNEAVGDGSIMADAQRLWSWSDSVLDGGADAAAWSVRWDAVLPPAAVDEAAAKLGLRREEDGTRYVREEEDYRMVLWTGDSSGAESEDVPVEVSSRMMTVIVLLEGENGVRQPAFLERIEQVEASWPKIEPETGQQVRASLAFRGMSEYEDAGERMARQARAERVEAYEDGGTSSITYYSPDLARHAVSGGKKVNLQLAKRLDAKQGRWLITGGTPLITGDYSAP